MSPRFRHIPAPCVQAVTVDQVTPHLLAVEHGIEPQLRGGEVQVIARFVDREAFELRVLDDGAGLLPNAPEGVGLANSRERLHHQFGARAELRIGARGEGPGTEVRLCIQPDSGGSQRG